MTPALGLLLGLALGVGVLFLVQGMRRTPVSDTRPGKQPSRLLAPLHRLTRVEKTRAALALIVALALYALTGRFVLVIVLPVAAVMLPRLLSTSGSGERIDRLEALEEWSRSLAGIMSGGRRLTDALVSSVKSAPEPIREDIKRLATRAQSPMPLRQALYMAADDLDSETADLIFASLVQSVGRDTATAKVLKNTAEMVTQDVRGLRKIELDRRDARLSANLITGLAGLGLVVLLITPMGKAYWTSSGQVVLLAILGGFAAILYWIQSATTPPAPRRFLTQNRTTVNGEVIAHPRYLSTDVDEDALSSTAAVHAAVPAAFDLGELGVGDLGLARTAALTLGADARVRPTARSTLARTTPAGPGAGGSPQHTGDQEVPR